MAAGLGVAPARRREMFDQAVARIAERFGRVEPGASARAYVLGLLSNIKRGNCWQLAERAVHIGTDEHRHLLIRRSRTTGELAFYLCWSPTALPLSELVHVAGARWSVEECFKAAKSQVGLDHYQVRNWTSWHRHITLAMLALAFLTALAVSAAPDRHHPGPQQRPDLLDRPGDPPPTRRRVQPADRDRSVCQRSGLSWIQRSGPCSGPRTWAGRRSSPVHAILAPCS
ncbi:transposase [Streptomyces halstedii]|uniref:transposase n=1 Tax=Streptomyces halstedii TaxID=1944 RepID=UPI0019423090